MVRLRWRLYDLTLSPTKRLLCKYYRYMNECDCSDESTFKRCRARRYAMKALKCVCGMNNGITQLNDIEIYSVLKWNQQNAFNVPKYVWVVFGSCCDVLGRASNSVHTYSERVRYERCVHTLHDD